MPTTVVNFLREPYDEYIGRAGKGKDGYFGNPHPIGYCYLCKRTHDREDAIQEFKKYFYERVNKDLGFMIRVLELKGKTLGCFCKPLSCHGDVIAEWLDSQP